MTIFHFSTNSTAVTHEITHDGRKYLIAPVVALCAGVLNDRLLTADEFGKFAQAWNGRAVPIQHPQVNGEYISANSPDVWANEVLGHFWNAAIDGDKLRGEIWIDLDKATKLGGKAMTAVNRLRANKPVEVSTGYFADVEETKGVWNGKAYSGIARNIRPDHLALLLDEEGACNWADGCGTPRVNRKEAMQTNVLELSDRISLVRAAFWKKYGAGDMDYGPDMNILAVFDDTLIAKDWVGKGHQAYPYTISDDGAVAFGGPVPVEVVYRTKDGGTEIVVNEGQEQAELGLFERFRRWMGQRKIDGITTVQAQTGAEEKLDMGKDTLVAALVANKRCKFDKGKLDGWEEADLQALSDSLTANEEAAATPIAGVTEETQVLSAPLALPAEITQFADMIRGMGGVGKLAEALGSLTANADQERADLIADITANERNSFGEVELKAMPTEHLRKLASALLPRDYSGAAGVVRNSRQEESYVLEMPNPWAVKKEEGK